MKTEKRLEKSTCFGLCISIKIFAPTFNFGFEKKWRGNDSLAPIPLVQVLIWTPGTRATIPNPHKKGFERRFCLSKSNLFSLKSNTIWMFGLVEIWSIVMAFFHDGLEFDCTGLNSIPTHAFIIIQKKFVITCTSKYWNMKMIVKALLDDKLFAKLFQKVT